jgi:hypothetical protein
MAPRQVRVVGDAHPARTRLAGWLDGAAALVVTIIAWPFPLMRTLVPWPVHVASILIAVLVVDALLRVSSLLVWGRTPFMYLLDLALAHPDAASAPDVRDSEGFEVTSGSGSQLAAWGWAETIEWSLGWSLGLLPSLVGAHALVDPQRGLPARLSGLLTRSVA